MLKSLDEIFDYQVKQVLKAKISCEDRLLHPFSTLRLELFDGSDLLYEFVTVFKCDIWQGCKYCFTTDLRKLYFERGRTRIYASIDWWGCVTFKGVPVFEDSYYEECLITDKVVLLHKGKLLVFPIPEGLEIEHDGEIVRLDSRVGTFFTRKVLIK